jgi:hypothetical protein
MWHLATRRRRANLEVALNTSRLEPVGATLLSDGGRAGSSLLGRKAVH